jgi:hypothetical protein
LLQEVSLPPGHLTRRRITGIHAPVLEDATVDAGRLAQRSLRAGWVASVLETELRIRSGSLSGAGDRLSPVPA